MSHHTVTNLFLVFLLFAGIGCKSSTSPSSSSPSGTLIFGESAGVGEAVIGSNTSSVLFQGYDPSNAPGGKVIYAVGWNYTANGHELIEASSPDGTNTQLLLDLEASVDDEPSNPKMSPDGKYFCFNYSNFAQQLGTHYGTLVYASSGTYLGYVENVWDASWGPDGSLVVSGTVTPYTGVNWTPLQQGLWKVDKAFTTSTPIGTGLTTPQFPCVSPDGTKVSFEMNSHIWMINEDGTGLKQVTTGPNTESYSCWSPDGTEIACVSNGDFGFYVQNAMAIVNSNPSTPTTVSSADASLWVMDNGNYVEPQSNVAWR
jgi:Tol biopolymer transport system component